MRRITLWLFSTVAALVLLFSYRTSTSSAGPATTVAQAPIIPAPTPTSTPTTAPTGSATPAPSASSGTAGGSRTYTGSVAQTRWGPVQIAITVSGGRITDVTVPTYPNGNGRDQEINASALPILTSETLSAQNASIDGVSGATVTSDGYKESLQAALDAAHLS
jgi:uncharacterized protein with FMN-binding domain